MPFQIEKPTQITEKVRARFDAKYHMNKVTACWEWCAFRNAKGYGTFSITRDARLYAHRASWLLHRGAIPAGLLVLHHCDNPSCVNPDHLFLGTARDNTQDMLRKGRAGATTAGGENSPLSKLSDEQVIEIRAHRAMGALLHIIAARYSVSTSNVSRICAGKSRKQPSLLASSARDLA